MTCHAVMAATGDAQGLLPVRRRKLVSMRQFDGSTRILATDTNARKPSICGYIFLLIKQNFLHCQGLTHHESAPWLLAIVERPPCS
jgi:hypothetical protein